MRTDGITGLVAHCVVMALLLGCGSTPRPGNERSLSISGSDTMLILNRRLAEAYMRSHPGFSVRVNGGGTSTGVTALLAGEVEVCAASRPLTPEEVQSLYERNETLGVRFLIAQDPLSVWVNPGNPVDDLTMDELGRVFSGSVGNWSEIGGGGSEIHVVVRPPASGTHRFFRDRVLSGGAYSPRAVTAAATSDVVREVAADPAAIGYGGAAYSSEDVRSCAVEGHVPTAENVGLGLYPLTRHLVFITVSPPRGLAKDFIEWCQGADGQAVVAQVGYLPLWQRP